MLNLTEKFSQEVKDAVSGEELVAIPNFPGNDNKVSGPKMCFVTPDMEAIYKSRTGQNLPDFVFVDMRIPTIKMIVGNQTKPVEEGINVMTLWINKHNSNKLVKVIKNYL